MKFIKSKITVALLLTIISFGAFSFTTTPVNAQSTVSKMPNVILLQDVPQLPAAALANEEALHVAGQAVRVAKALAQAVVTSVVSALIFGENSGEQLSYPADTLDNSSRNSKT